MNRALVIAGVVWREMIRRKDVYVLLILLAAMLFSLLSLNLFGLGAVTRYLMDVGLLMAWLFSIVLVVSLSSRQLPQEEARGTIYPLLAKPVTRGEMLAGKWAGAWSAAVAATALFYAVVMGLAVLRGGRFDGLCLAQAFLLHAVALAVLCALALALSTRMTAAASAALTYVAAVAAFVLAPSVPVLLGYETGPSASGLLILYYALPHLDLFDLRQRVIHDWGAASWSTAGQVALYGAIWTLLLLTLAWLAYRRKRFARGRAL